MKYTLLGMTQDILSNLSSDEVNSISDTTESMQVATIIRQKYFDIISRIKLPEHEQMIQLNPSADPSMPTLMYVPDGVENIDWIKYFDSNVMDDYTGTEIHDLDLDISLPWTTTSSTANTIMLGSVTFTVPSGLKININDPCIASAGNNEQMQGFVVSYTGTTLVINSILTTGSGSYSSWNIYKNINTAGTAPGYLYVHIVPIQEFLHIVNRFNPADTNVETFTFTANTNGFPGSYSLNYLNDRQPKFCTIISNYYVIFDSYDNTQDSTLQASKSMAWAKIEPQFLMQDNFTPSLKDEQFQLLLNEAKALAFYELKQQPHQLATQETRRGWSTIQKNKDVKREPTDFGALPDFGRRTYRRGYINSSSDFR